jgi:AraC-like DNA-binding protein
VLVYLGTGWRTYHASPIPERPRRAWEFQSVLAGIIAPVVDGRPEPLRTRTLWAFPPAQSHGWTGEPEGRAEVAVFHYSTVPDAFAAWFGDRTGHAAPLDDAALATLRDSADLAAAHIRHPTELSPLHFDGILHRLCQLALAGVRETPLQEEAVLAHHRSDTAVAWYLANLHHQPDLGEVAASVHCSPAHLRRMFLRARGRPPREVLREAQLQRAEELLAETAWPLRRIASASGFRHLEVFCRVFARHRGSSPGRWRQRLGGGPSHRDHR